MAIDSRVCGNKGRGEDKKINITLEAMQAIREESIDYAVMEKSDTQGLRLYLVIWVGLT